MKALAATIAVAVLAVVARPAPRPAVAPDRIPAAIAAYYGAPTPAIANIHRHDVCNLTAGRHIRQGALPMIVQPAWRQRARCRGLDPNLFFPGRGEPTAEAKAVCAHCPVDAPCLEYALAGDEVGIWGGTSERERRQIRRKRRAAAAAARRAGAAA